MCLCCFHQLKSSFCQFLTLKKFNVKSKQKMSIYSQKVIIFAIEMKTTFLKYFFEFNYLPAVSNEWKRMK
jgi:hypothetical protein